MQHYRALTFIGLALATPLFQSPALAKCAQPAGQYVGQGAGPIFFKGSTLLGGRNEVWALTFPTATQEGSISLKARSHPQLGVSSSYYSIYELTNAPVGIIGSSTPQTTWDPASCTGSMRVKGAARIVWIDAKGVGAASTYDLDQLYTYTSADSGRIVTFTIITSVGPFAPTYSIRLERP